MSTDRRARIVTGAIELIAAHGIRALTHRAVDTALALPAGSTSYYFRTRQALIAAVADGITARSHADFVALRTAEISSTADIAHGIATWLDELLARRRDELVARHALIIEVRGDADLHARLANSLFSMTAATDLFAGLGDPEPRARAADFLALLEGLVFDRLAGLRADEPAGTDHNVEQLTRPLARFLERAGPARSSAPTN
ncbi:transcriptional regulator [Nocardia sp. NPDC050717]|uniref:TetR/AcrR family transcriptional regulator n=1 Tax=Nocardia sp. NPDC050717 TaxID=3157221 RepID=UPI0033D64178